MDRSGTNAEPTAPAPLDEDLYCLTCAYNLRGLSGDPVRCPECGDAHTLELLRAPAWAIRYAVGRMETAPTTCVALAAAATLCFGTAWFLDGPGRGRPSTIVGTAALGLLCLMCWPIACWHVRRAFSAQPGWTSIVSGFHLAAGLCTLWYPLALSYFIVASRTPVAFRRGTGWMILALAAGALWLGLRVYRRARRLLAVIQRREVLRIVEEVLSAQRRAPRAFRLGR